MGSGILLEDIYFSEEFQQFSIPFIVLKNQQSCSHQHLEKSFKEST